MDFFWKGAEPTVSPAPNTCEVVCRGLLTSNGVELPPQSRPMGCYGDAGFALVWHSKGFCRRGGGGNEFCPSTTPQVDADPSCSTGKTGERLCACACTEQLAVEVFRVAVIEQWYAHGIVPLSNVQSSCGRSDASAGNSDRAIWCGATADLCNPASVDSERDLLQRCWLLRHQ